MTAHPQADCPTPSFPRIINIEVFRGACPCRCVHCPVGALPPEEREAYFGRGSLSPALFEKLACEIAGHPESCLRLHSVGEPLLWPELPRALAAARELKISTWLFTCAVTRDQRLLDAVCDLTSILEVSVNSITAEDYRAAKGIDAWDLVCRNIEYLSRRIAERGLPTRLILSRVQSGDAEADNAFVDYWQRRGLAADVFVRSYHSYNGLLDEPHAAAGRGARGPCLVHWARFNISCSGKAVVCFNELFKPQLSESVVLGDCGVESIAAIWQGAKLSAIRRIERRGALALLPEDLPCRTCTSCQPLGAENPSSEVQLKDIAAC